jgi:hypothetical protein
MSDGARYAWVPLVLLSAMGAAAVTATLSSRAMPPATTRTITVRPTPDVLRAVQDLARLETVSFHMERVVDLREAQARAWGLIEAEDAILLVAVGDVVAGVDLVALRPEDVRADPAASTATLTLPRATVFSARLDSERTYVHSRTTDVLAQRQEQLETRARQEAERSIAAAAQEAGILRRAEENAARTITGLVRAMGFRDVNIRWR